MGKKKERKAAKAELRSATALPRADLVEATTLTGAKKVKAKCCRSEPRCKSCPVVLMRARRLADSGLSGKDLKKAIKAARAA